MNELVKELYLHIPEFDTANDHFFDEFDYTVFGSFGLFIEDLANLESYGFIQKRNFYHYNVEDLLNGSALKGLIYKSFAFIEKKYLEGDSHSKEVINVAFFKMIVTSDILLMYAKKSLSQSLYQHIITIWNIK